MRMITFFTIKGGVGTTSLVYHLAWMYREMGLRVVAVDLDPQSNLTLMFLDEERLEDVWPNGEHPLSLLGAVRPIIRGTGDIAEPHIEEIEPDLGLVIGDLGLSSFEAYLSDAWPKCLDRQEAAFRTTSSLARVVQQAGTRVEADVVLIDVGPNLGAINRAALLAATHVVVPLAPDLFSLQGLRNLGPTLRRWQVEWQARLPLNPDPNLHLPAGTMQPAGYVVMQHAVRLNRPVLAYEKWANRVPAEYRQHVLNQPGDEAPSAADDPNRLALLKHFRSLMPMAQEARKPMFKLKPADGAIGAHAAAVQDVYRDFRALALRIAERVGLALPV